MSDNIEHAHFMECFVPEKDYDEIFILSPLNKRFVLMDMLCKDAIPYYYSPAEEIHAINKELHGTWLWITGDQSVPFVKITGYDFVCANTIDYVELSITGLFDYIVSQISSGNQRLYSSSEKMITNIGEKEVTG